MLWCSLQMCECSRLLLGSLLFYSVNFSCWWVMVFGLVCISIFSNLWQVGYRCSVLLLCCVFSVVRFRCRFVIFSVLCGLWLLVCIISVFSCIFSLGRVNGLVRQLFVLVWNLVILLGSLLWVVSMIIGIFELWLVCSWCSIFGFFMCGSIQFSISVLQGWVMVRCRLVMLLGVILSICFCDLK